MTETEIRRFIVDVLRCSPLKVVHARPAKESETEPKDAPTPDAEKPAATEPPSLVSEAEGLYGILRKSTDTVIRNDAAAYLLKLIEKGGELDEGVVRALYDAEKDLAVAAALRRVINKLQIRRVLPEDPTSPYDRALSAREEVRLLAEIAKVRDIYDSAKGKSGNFDSRYKVLYEIGKGGMARIIKALRLSDNRSVAIKYLMMDKFSQQVSPETLDTIIARFKREGELLCGRLDHPNILKGYEFGESEKGHFIVLEYVDGGTLHGAGKPAPLSFVRFRGLSAQLLDAVEYLHHEGIIHRDIKPKNVLLDNSSSSRNVKLADFGIAKDKGDQTLTQVSFRAYTADYSSPQQRRDSSDVDERDDIYSLGITFYEMLTGTIPAQDGPYVPLTLAESRLSAHLNGVILKCIAPERLNRWQSVKDLRGGLFNGL